MWSGQLRSFRRTAEPLETNRPSNPNSHLMSPRNAPHVAGQRLSRADRLANRSRPQVIELAFSILGSDFAHLADEVAAAERGGGTIVHIDVMDGPFVPNITFGPAMVKAIRPVTNLP